MKTVIIQIILSGDPNAFPWIPLSWNIMSEIRKKYFPNRPSLPKFYSLMPSKKINFNEYIEIFK